MAHAATGYLEPADFVAAVHHCAEAAGERARLDVIGQTVEGRPIEAVTVAAPGATPDPERPLAVVLAGMHGVEVIGTQLALAVLEAVCADEPSGDPASLLAVADLTVIPCLNVDSRTASMDSLGRRGVLVGAPRGNANGVDLNRNWPFPAGVTDHWLPIAGTRVRWLPWFRGPQSALGARSVGARLVPRAAPTVRVAQPALDGLHSHPSLELQDRGPCRSGRIPSHDRRLQP